MGTGTRRRVGCVAVLVILALGAAACDIESTFAKLGCVYGSSAPSAPRCDNGMAFSGGDAGERGRQIEFGGRALIVPCASERVEDPAELGRPTERLDCPYPDLPSFNGAGINGGTLFIIALYYLAARIDPLLLQVPEGTIVVDASYNARAQEQLLQVTSLPAPMAAPGVPILAEPGTEVIALDFPPGEAESIPDAGRAYDLSLTLDFPASAGDAPVVKVVSALRIALGGQVFHPPVYPCRTDFTDVPPIELGVGTDPEPLLNLMGAYISDEAALACDGPGYDFSALQPADTVARHFGPTRLETAVEVSRQLFPIDGSADAAVIARADDFPDALAGTALAEAVNGPILLTRQTSVDVVTAEELGRVLPLGRTIYILGGEAALGPGVEILLQRAWNVVRLGGANRFETAAAILSEIERTHPINGIYLADGGSFQSALLAGVEAALDDRAVLLTSGSDLPLATSDALTQRGDLPLVAIGSAAAAAAPDAEAVDGEDPAGLSVAVAERRWGTHPPIGAAFASAEVFADGLTGGPLTERLRVPLLLSTADALSQPVATYLRANAETLTEARIFGGTAALSAEVEAAILAGMS